MGLHRKFRTGLGVLRQHPPRPLALEPPAPADPLPVVPSIHIATPSFNQAGFIDRTVQSVLGQDYPDLSYVVKDGGSNDGTIDRLTAYSPDLVQVLAGPDGGQAAAINEAFRNSDADVMGWVNSDDLLLPGTLHRVAATFVRNPDVDVVYGHRVLVDRRDHEIGRWVMPEHDGKVLSWADYVPQETLFWRRRIWRASGGALDETFQFAMDWDLILRFRAAGAVFHRIPAFLGAFRVHGEQKTTADMKSIGEGEMNRLRRRELGRDVTQDEVNRAVKPYLLKATLAHNLELARSAASRVRTRGATTGRDL